MQFFGKVNQHFLHVMNEMLLEHSWTEASETS